MTPPSYSNLPARFWDKVEVDSSGCWLWTRFRDRDGYGSYTVSRGKSARPHRLSAADAKGEIPSGLWVLHHCDNPPCVNPDHLYYGTPQQNVDDMMRRGGNGISLGVKNGQSKLTDKAVVEIRNLYKGGGHTYQTLADIYGVGMRTVADAITQKTWGHVEQETVPLEKAR